MLKLNEDYSDYFDSSDENYPEGKAINASSSESYDGTPVLADFLNDINAAHIAMYEKAYGNREGISGVPDNQKVSQFADAVAKLVIDKIKDHADLRGLSDNVHGATEEASPGQIASRDENGNIQVGAAIHDSDAVNKRFVNQKFDVYCPCGTVLHGFWRTAPEGWFMLDGSEYVRADYPDLWDILKDIDECKGNGVTTFRVPDLRECTLVGAGKRTSGVAAHDVYGLGEFKDDQLQGHQHGYVQISSGPSSAFNVTVNQVAGINAKTKTIVTDDVNGTPRIGTTTHGKQFGVNYIIKY